MIEMQDDAKTGLSEQPRILSYNSIRRRHAAYSRGAPSFYSQSFHRSKKYFVCHIEANHVDISQVFI